MRADAMIRRFWDWIAEAFRTDDAPGDDWDADDRAGEAQARRMSWWEWVTILLVVGVVMWFFAWLGIIANPWGRNSTL
jgi:hypothetical protein